MESRGRPHVVRWSIMANNDGPGLVRTVEGNLPGLSRRLKAAANLLDARAAAPPQQGSLAKPVCCSAHPNKQWRLTETYPTHSEQEGGQGATVPAPGPSYPAPGQT